MAHMQIIAQTTARNQTELVDATAEPLQARQLTRSQWQTLQNLLLPRLPVTFTLAQRTPKGTLYVTLADGQRFTIDCRAKLQKIN